MPVCNQIDLTMSSNYQRLAQRSWFLDVSSCSTSTAIQLSILPIPKGHSYKYYTPEKQDGTDP